MPACIAVDAMGGDNAPEVVIKGVAEYLTHNSSNTEIILVGSEKQVKKEVRKIAPSIINKVKFRNAKETVSMREQLFSYWKKREETSVKIALDMVKKGDADAMVSAGNTGAVTAFAKTSLGTLDTIDRPALAIMIPTLKGFTMLMDVGANVDSKPRNLVQSALMGKIYLENVYRIKNPRIALMSVGEEDIKGNELTKATFNILKSLDINFIGNIEGRDAYIGDVDLIVTDGFTGNITLKVTEGVVSVMLSMMKREIMSSLLSKVGFFFLRSSVKRILKKLDYAETGGALLLGVKGIVVIGHGNSSAKAIRNAIELSCRFLEENVLQKIAEEVREFQSVLKELKYV